MDEIVRTIDCDYLQPEFAAAFLRVSGEQAAFIETNTSFAVPTMLGELARAGRAPEDVRWILVTHVHLDHAGGAGALAAACPNATVLAHPRAARHLRDPSKRIAGATAVYGQARFDELYGVIEPIDPARVRELADGEQVEFGAGQLRVLHTEGHANHHFVVVDPAASAVFTGDTFGLAYPRLQRHGVFAFPSTSPVGFDAARAHESVERVLALGMQSAYLTHFGPQRELAEIAEQLHGWIDFAEGLRLRARERHGEAGLHEELEQAFRDELGRRADVRGLALDAQDWELVRLDLELNAQGIAAVAARGV